MRQGQPTAAGAGSGSFWHRFIPHPLASRPAVLFHSAWKAGLAGRERAVTSRGKLLGACKAVLTVLPLLTAACYPRPETAYDAQQPSTRAVRNIGNFNEALRCMDGMFLAQGKRDVYITTAGIPDATGLIATGTKEMFISAVSRMSAKSGAFRFVDYDPTQLDVQVLSELVGLKEDFVAPNYYVRGAITQLDSSVLSSSAAAGLSIPQFDLAISGSQVVSIVSMDLNVGQLTTRQILPGISANNSIAVVQRGKGADIGGLIGKAGLSLSVSLDKSEGFHQAVRSLVELSTIEVLGKLTHVPYWECLSIEATNPNFRAEAREWFDTMGESERQSFVRSALARAGYLGAAEDGSGAKLTDAMARYQAENDLVANGRLDFDLYYRLLASDSRRPGSARAPVTTATAPPMAAPPPAAVPAVASAPAPVEKAPPRLTLANARGANPSYRVGETITLSLQPTQDAYTYCYYQDGAGSVSRIFPNRFQPDPLIPARRLIQVPPAGGAFAIRFDRPRTRESFLCVAANREVGLRLPDTLKAQDLARLPVRDLDDVAARFQALPGAQVDEARLVVEVTP
jgi:hypothetical protein